MISREPSAVAPSGWRVARFPVIDSTNEEARRWAFTGDSGQLWVIAEEQTAGRGRRGRDWSSPRGNLHASALLLDPCAPARAAELGFVAGVALARAAQDLGSGARLKWPNDLVQPDGAKCAGLLVEGLQLPEGRFACIVGIGVNCVHAPEGAAYPTALLLGSDGPAADPGVLFGRLAHRFVEALAEWRRGAGFAVIRSDWLAAAMSVGQKIRIQSAGGRREGTFEGLGVDGRLLFRGEYGIETVEAADLWIMPGLGDMSAAAVSAPVARESRI